MLTTPFIINTPLEAFDAKKDYRIKFQVMGGEQVFSHEVEIQDNNTRRTVFQTVYDGFDFESNIPANSLINGKEYRVRIKTYNIDKVGSEWSDWQLFHCFTTPTFVINNVNNVLELNNYTFKGLYFQDENEELESYQYILYDDNGYTLQASEVKYDNKLEHSVTGLVDGYEYMIEMKGETVNSIKITTGKVKFLVEVIKPSTALAFNVENIRSEGQIKISSNILEVKGDSVNGALTYIDDTFVSLKGKDEIVRFDKGFTVRGNFTLKLWVKQPNDNSVIAEIYERNSSINDRRLLEVMYRSGRFELRKRFGNLSPYYIYSEPIYITDDDVVMVFINCKDERYNIEVWKVGDAV